MRREELVLDRRELCVCIQRQSEGGEHEQQR